MIPVSPHALIVLLVIGAIAGSIAGLIMGSRMGLIGNIIVGVVGAFLGSWLFQQLGIYIRGPGFMGISVNAVVAAIVGAAILMFIIRLVRR